MEEEENKRRRRREGRREEKWDIGRRKGGRGKEMGGSGGRERKKRKGGGGKEIGGSGGRERKEREYRIWGRERTRDGVR